jgi:hypothetical protein
MMSDAQYNHSPQSCPVAWPDLGLYAIENSHNWFLIADGLGIKVGPGQLFNPQTLFYKFFKAKYVEPSRPGIRGRDFPCGVSREAWQPHVRALLRDHGTIAAADTTVSS